MTTESDDPITKRCARCKDAKPLSDFNRHGQSRDGRFSYCRDCSRNYDHERAAKNGIVRVSRREPRLGQKWCPDCADHLPVDAFGMNRSTKDGRTAYCRTHQRERVNNSRMRVHGGSRHYHLVRRYGVSSADVDHMIEQQQGLCPVCERDLGVKPHVDHDHDTGAVRQVLCFTCNGGLGLFGDDPARLRAAAAYVERHRGTKTPALDWPTMTIAVPPATPVTYYAGTHGLAPA